MKYAVISDVHGNLEALDTTLRDIDRKKVDDVLCCGDVVGYGPKPVECIQTLRKNGVKTVAGNHDMCVSKRMSFEGWRGEATDTWNIAQKLLKDDDREWLSNLGESMIIGEDILMVHGSPRFPTVEYLTDISVGLYNLSLLPGYVCFVGHSHVPLVLEFSDVQGRAYHPRAKRFFWTPPLRVLIKTGHKYFINPGSVGQPRDGNPKSSYCIYDTLEKHVTHYRVPYHFEITQDQMIDRYYPEFLIMRLPHGI